MLSDREPRASAGRRRAGDGLDDAAEGQDGQEAGVGQSRCLLCLSTSKHQSYSRLCLKLLLSTSLGFY